MKKLPERVKLRGLGYDVPVFATLVTRTDKKAMYSVKHPNAQVYYEVFKIHTREAEISQSGKQYPEREVYPGNEDVGDWAWCIRSYERARIRYDKL